jgi:hypothetical protein
MHAMLRFLPLMLALAGCASTSSSAPKAVGPDAERFTYHTVVESVPPGAVKLVLRVHLPERIPASTVLATGLVGNAPFELAIPVEAGAVHGEHVDVSWDDAGRELRVTTRGRPLELGLRFAIATAGAPAAGAATDVPQLEEELALGTMLEIDERPAEEPRHRLERVR